MVCVCGPLIMCVVCIAGVHSEENNNKDKLKATVVALMKHISGQIGASQNLPDAQQLNDMKEELSFKAQKLKNSQNTLVALEEG